MNDHLPNRTLDDLPLDSTPLDVGSFEGFDPFAEEAQSVESPTAEATESNVTPLLQMEEAPLPSETVTPAPQQVEATPLASAPVENPLQQAIEKAEEKDVKQAVAPLFSRPPVFCHGGVSEEITDPKMTFDQLREEKARDFSELEEAGKVSWTMEYGKTVRAISKPQKEVIFAVKKEIETSKAFLDALKKDGAKGLTCKVKPRITAQKKGIAAYKGVFTSLEEAEQAQKPISILPARDGKVYEFRRTPLGTFIAPAENVEELSEVRAGFRPVLPPVPLNLFLQVIAFFRSFLREGQELEALVHLYWDSVQKEYRVVVPPQWVEKASVDAVLSENDVLDQERYLHFADIHSHNTMAAKFSITDDMDERATRVYLVVGRLDHYFPQVEARISCNSRFVSIPTEQIISPLPSDFPCYWTDTVHIGHREVA